MFAGFGRGDGHLLAKSGREWDVESVDVRRFDHFLVAAHGAGNFRVRSLCLVFPDILSGPFLASAGYGHQFGILRISNGEPVFSRDPSGPERVITYAQVTPDELFQVARLVVSAQIAKIHTIEWTTQLLYDEPLYRGLNANWNGLLEEYETLSKLQALGYMAGGD